MNSGFTACLSALANVNFGRQPSEHIFANFTVFHIDLPSHVLLNNLNEAIHSFSVVHGPF